MTSYTEHLDTDSDVRFEDGQFNDATKWNVHAGWTVAGGVAHYANVANNFIQVWQVRPKLIVDNFYDVTFEIKNQLFIPPNGIIVVCGGTWSIIVDTANGIHTQRIQCGNVDQKLAFQNSTPIAGGSADIDNVSVIAIGTQFKIDTDIDHRSPRAAVRYSVPDGDRIYHALSYRDKTNCYIKYTP